MERLSDKFKISREGGYDSYKSNAPTLNALLTIMNEHFFYNDGRPVPIPLISMFGASNEPPEDKILYLKF